MSAKRPAPSSFSSSNAPTKRAPPLTAFFPSSTGPARPPQPVVASDPLTDRASTFVAHAAPCTNHVQAATLHAHVRALRTPTHPVECSHEVLAWRCMGLRPGRTGLDGEDDWRVEGGADDDGEKGAGAVVREVLDKEGGVDVALVVSRLYGGIMLGPARFAHIRTVASQALARLLAAQRLASLTAQLHELDAEIAALSSSSSTTTSSTTSTSTPASTARAPPPPTAASTAAAYKALTVDKAERLVAAREKRLGLLRERASKTNEEGGTGDEQGAAGTAGGAVGAVEEA
ncbi:hypothetical protein JCM8208_007586 [Rhodotorula glutinis]